jgi:hypothetical protein
MCSRMLLEGLGGSGGRLLGVTKPNSRWEEGDPWLVEEESSAGENGFLRKVDTSWRSATGVDSRMGSRAVTRRLTATAELLPELGLRSGPVGGAKRVLV